MLRLCFSSPDFPRWPRNLPPISPDFPRLPPTLPDFLFFSVHSSKSAEAPAMRAGPLQSSRLFDGKLRQSHVLTFPLRLVCLHWAVQSQTGGLFSLRSFMNIPFCCCWDPVCKLAQLLISGFQRSASRSPQLRRHRASVNLVRHRASLGL